jgi:Rad3-related DNA helicase
MKEVVENFSTLVAELNPLAITRVPVKNTPAPKIDALFDQSYWSLYENNKPLEPLVFSNGKSQEDIVHEVVELVKGGTKVIFIHGVCGTGKSAIALNIARKLGRASIVVPVKALQKQYENDYMGHKYLLKPNGLKLKIAMITGRDNHDSVIKPGVTCADPSLPENIRITEKNLPYLREYYNQNPYVKNKKDLLLKEIKRLSVAPSNPYWSPILPASFEIPFKDATKKRYTGLDNNEFIFYHRKEGCTYYDQYQAYIDADVIIFNAAKYKIESALNRKPLTDVEIIDEADEFLDNFSQQQTINLTRLANTLSVLNPASMDTREAIESIKECIKLEEKNKSALGINEKDIFKLQDTKLKRVLELLVKNPEIEEEMQLDEQNYVTRALEVAHALEEFFDDTYASFRREESDLIVSLVTTNISKQFQEIIAKNKALVLMSGTLHNAKVLKEVFGIPDIKIVEAETATPGTLEIVRTGKEFDCKYSNFQAGNHTREDYLKALDLSVEKAKRPTLVHVNAFEDLPTIEETFKYNLKHAMPQEQLRELQINDKDGRQIALFKKGLNDVLFTTKCSRGVDFPGKMCNSIVFTKFPNPNPRELFWKILQQTHASYFWDLYKDKAQREFLQRLYRALRSRDDHVYVLSPDLRVLQAVQELQKQQHKA